MIVYAICLPLAIILGFLVSDPLDRNNDITVAFVLFLLVLPLLLRWYHAWLITVWNMSITFIFLPGLLPGWMPVACIAFAVALGHYALNRERKFLQTTSISWSLIFLAVVVLVTAKLRGGLGFHAFGDEAIGGKRYLWIWVAIAGYFALISQPIPPKKRKLYTTLFVVSAGSALFADIAAHGGPFFGFLNIFFPTGPMAAESPVGDPMIERLGGVAVASSAVVFTLVARYGIEGVLDLRKLWRPMLFFSALVCCAFGGYRSTVILVGMTLVLAFCFEGLLRSRLMPAALLGILLLGGLTISFSDRLPLSFQRCLAFLPVKIDEGVRLNAEGSSDWRLDMWRNLTPQIPKYLLLGKGLTFDANDMQMYAEVGNYTAGGEVGGAASLASDYHNGPLSLIIPFGIWGTIGFLWFLVASFKLLWANYKYGDPDLRKTNAFLLAYFIAKMILFFFVFGGFYGDLAVFTGMVGFSASLNGGIAKPAPAPVIADSRPRIAFSRFRPLPAGGPVTTHQNV